MNEQLIHSPTVPRGTESLVRLGSKRSLYVLAYFNRLAHFNRLIAVVSGTLKTIQLLKIFIFTLTESRMCQLVIQLPIWGSMDSSRS